MQVITPERTYTADGNDRFLGNFEFGIATKFIDDLRANVRRGNRARLQQGWPNFRPPIGYLEDRSGTTTTVVKDPDRFPLVRRMWDELLAGRMNPFQLAAASEGWGLRTRRTAHQGGKPLSFQYVYRMFSNPYYMGLIQLTSGESHPGAHEPMVTAEEFEQAQIILRRPERTRSARHVFAYGGLLSCALCGRKLVPEVHVKRSGKRFVYYRCRGRTLEGPCPNPCLPEKALEAQILADLKRVRLPAAATDWITKNVQATIEATASEQRAERKAQECSLADAGRELDALLTLKLHGQVEDETFERRRLELMDRQAKLRIRLSQPIPAPEALLAQVERLLQFSSSLPEAFTRSDAVRRRQIFHLVCANPTVRDRKALYLAKKPFSFFEGKGSLQRWSPRRESNPYLRIRNPTFYPLNYEDFS